MGIPVHCSSTDKKLLYSASLQFMSSSKTPPTEPPRKMFRRFNKKRNDQKKSTRASVVAEPASNTAPFPEDSRTTTQPESMPEASSSRLVELLQIPTALNAPVSGEINFKAIHRNFPDTTGQDWTILREQWAEPSLAQAMIDGAVGCEIEEPPFESNAMFPSDVQITIHVTTAPTRRCPSHVLASTRHDRTGRAHGFYLFAIHDMPFALNCTRFPDFPPSDTTTTGSVHTAFVPVIFFDLPSPATFECLRTYLYNKDLEELESRLLPPRSKWAMKMDTAEKRVSFILGFWKNACTLGVLDDYMYALINRCWDVVYKDRLRLATGGRKISQ